MFDCRFTVIRNILTDDESLIHTRNPYLLSAIISKVIENCLNRKKDVFVIVKYWNCIFELIYANENFFFLENFCISIQWWQISAQLYTTEVRWVIFASCIFDFYVISEGRKMFLWLSAQSGLILIDILDYWIQEFSR